MDQSGLTVLIPAGLPLWMMERLATVWLVDRDGDAGRPSSRPIRCRLACRVDCHAYLACDSIMLTLDQAECSCCQEPTR
jgi:hypothetical protein